MGGNKPYTPSLPERDPHIVGYDGPEDKRFSHNWSLQRKLISCACVGMSALAVITGSALFAEGLIQVMAQFHIGSVVATLGTSLYVFGFASGPIIWGPLSELYGKKLVLVPSLFGFICFAFACGAAKDVQTIMICRFFGGFMGAAPLVVEPAVMSDMFTAKYRCKAMPIFAMILFGGPMLASILGAS